MDDRISFIKHYQNSIEKSQDNPERVLHCLKKLQNLRINVQDLQQTGIGKTVNSLRKLDGEAGELATELVTKWKDQISKMNEDDQKPEEVVKSSREKSQNDIKKSHHSSSKSSSAEHSDSNKKSKSHSSSSSNHHHSSNNHHSSSSGSTNHHHSSSSNHKDSNSSTNHHHSEQKEHKEKEKKSSDGKSSENKHHSHKSHHTSSSSSSHKTSNSHKRSRDDVESKEDETNAKKAKSDHERSDKKSHKSSESKESTSSTNGTSSKSKNKDHKSSSSSSKRKRSNEDDSKEFDGSEGIGFAEALAAFDMPCSSSKHRKHDMSDKMTSVKSNSAGCSSKSSSSAQKKDKNKDKEREKEKEKEKSSSSSSRPSTSTAEFKKPIQNLTQPPKLLTQKPKLELLPDIVNELPNDVSIPEYRPLPMNSAMKEYILGSNPQSRHTKQLTEGELLVQSFSSKANRTRVFSGNSKTRSEVPKLFDMCIRILQENIDYLECTGGVPFEILKPVLERAKAEQLSVIEYYNPYLLDDSDILWKPHCQRKWKNKLPREMETWRDMYDRCTREDEEKLSRLTQNIQQKQVITSSGIQKTKMAFVDSMVKPPRGMMRKQEQFGTNRKLVASPAARVEALKNIQPNLAAPGDVRLRVAAGLRDDAQQAVGRNAQRVSLTKKAPMMAKILSKFKR